MNNFDFLETRIAGLHFHEFAGMNASLLEFGLELSLGREPDNEHDRNAVRVDHPDGRKAGYIPAAQAVWLARLLDHGYKVGCHVSFVSAQQSLCVICLTLPDIREPSKEESQ